ncbi:ATP-dependent endonuclease [Aquipseudomonas alcaligenes]|uniref:Predicted ATP-dependent endonuclease of the OLD family, contains P-loop ATPase and TOPRIM domains n=1 Tax=Aquipseudomonas alcaligenes TaxID=43263 RepID=A0A1N6RNH9_AQUAC|nr:AAA family ATPase [Pseudomonas alcaligenes]SIQ30440.1 Predicted ATP-dependent endonuclease of the OLD family, contains P-loop ATPase and TOPRIM domains [Pseudomonas alcaligenes]
MKIRRIQIHNFRSIIDADIEAHDYTMLVGANNAGKSNIFGAIRAFYEDIKWSADDFPKVGATDRESWVELTFLLSDDEWQGLADKYKEGAKAQELSVRRYFASATREVKSTQSNIHAVVGGEPEKELFYGAKNISTAKVGSLIYIPALTTPTEQMKTSGPSPLRDMLNFMFKQLVASSAAYKALEGAFGALNDEARGEQGFLSRISGPINDAISHWGVRFDMGVNPISPEEITKNLVRHGFVDAMLGDTVFALERYGHGFQRSFLYELMKLAPTFVEVKSNEKKGFDSDFTLILFEEPEAFLHPSQQENMGFNLRRLGGAVGQQVLITTHSSTFVGKAADDLCQIVRVRREDGVSTAAQIPREKLSGVLGEGASLVNALRAFVDDQTVGEEQKGAARDLLKGAPDDEEIAAQEERFRYQLWLDSERASMFFAERILLVEGATEKALFTYLLARDWNHLARHRIAVVDVLGKFNFHRYMALLGGFSVPYGMMLDDDNDKNHHRAINEMLVSRALGGSVAAPVLLKGCMEHFLGVKLPGRDDKKPVEILKALEGNIIQKERLLALYESFVKALAL